LLVVFAQFSGVSATDAVCAVVLRVEAGDVFRPEPHEVARFEIMCDLDHRGHSFQSKPSSQTNSDSPESQSICLSWADVGPRKADSEMPTCRSLSEIRRSRWRSGS